MTHKSRKQEAQARDLPLSLLKVKPDRPTKTRIPLDNLLTKDNVREALADLIKNQAEITDLICIFKTRNNESIDCRATYMDIAQAVYMLDHTKFIYHEAQLVADGTEEDNGNEEMPQV